VIYSLLFNILTLWSILLSSCELALQIPRELLQGGSLKGQTATKALPDL
jgi:hypothetical protein